MSMRGLVDRLYCETLMEMCEEMPLGQITVKALVERAGTAKQTFYNHFRDINDLVSYIPINFLETTGFDLFDLEGLRRACMYTRVHPGFFGQLSDHKGQNSFRETFLAWLEQQCCDRLLLPELDVQEQLYRRLCIQVFCAGVVDVFLRWCAPSAEWPFELFSRVVADMAPDFLEVRY